MKIRSGFWFCAATAVLLAGSVSGYPGIGGGKGNAPGTGKSPHGDAHGAHDAKPVYFVGPYSTNITPTSARVHWIERGKFKPGMLAYSSGDHKGRVDTEVARFTGRDEEVFHTARLKDLKPDTLYRYVLHGGGGLRVGQFRTPPGKDDKPGPFRFVVYGDTRSRPKEHKSVADAIGGEADIVFVAVTGDMVGDGDDWDEWKEQFFDPAMMYLMRSAVWPVRGNHERSAVLYREHFELPGNEKWYSFDYGNVHFTVLDSHLEDESEHAEMLDWFRKDLANSDAEWKLVSYHRPTYNVGGHASKWGVADVLPILEENEVDFVLTGHSHIYERFKPIGLPGRKPVIHIVTGGGGAPMYDVTESPLLEGGTGQAKLHYCVFDVDGNRLTMQVKGPDGKVIDRVELVKKNGKYQRGVMKSMIGSAAAKMMAFQVANLEVDFKDGPVAGEWADARLALEHFPDGAKVTVSAHGKSGGWEVEEATTDRPGDGIGFRVRAPKDLKLVDGGLDPALRVRIRMEHDGEVTKVGSQPLIVSQETQRRLSKAVEPLAVFRANRKITVDGSDRDWDGVEPLPRKDGKPSSFRFAWTESGLHGIATVRDPEVAADPAKPWGADSVHVFVEKDFKRAVKDKNNPNAGAYIFSPGEPEGPADLKCWVGDRSDCPAIKSAWKKTDDGYAIEFTIGPEEMAPAKLEPGVTVGFNFAHCDGGKITESFRADWEWNTPFKWGAITLK